MSFVEKYGPWAVVAGASEGLGAEYAEQLAQRGLDLVLIARRAGLLQSMAARLKQKYKIEVCELPLDLASPNAPAQIVSATTDLDVGLLIYNAAYSAVGSFLDHPVEDHQASFAEFALQHRQRGSFGASRLLGILLVVQVDEVADCRILRDWSVT